MNVLPVPALVAPSPIPRSRLALAAAFLFFSCLAGAVVPAAEDATEAESRLAGAVQFLASDELEGRGVGTSGIDKAADYIAEQFAGTGLKVGGESRSPFQMFAIQTDAQIGPAANNLLALIGPPAGGENAPARIELKLGENFNTLALGGTAKVEAPLVFAGYGITAKDEGYDDYAGLDVKGKAVVLIRKEPQQNNPHSAFNGNQSSQHALFTRKVSNAYEHGAAAVILVNDLFGVEQTAEQSQKAWSEAMQKLLEIHQNFEKNQQPTPEEVGKYRNEVVELAGRIQQLAKQLASPDELIGFGDAGQSRGERNIPVFFCNRAVMDPIVTSCLGADLATLEKQIDEDLKPRSGELSGWRVNGESSVVRTQANVKNVIGVIEGSGSLANETIIVGAHYDHLGMGGSGSLAPWTREIHNGADDNASGTAALIEVARRIAGREDKPRRRIVFIAFTGEERGLLGSDQYVRNPLFPLENTVAMVNMDMVGRLRDNKLVVYGTGTALEFDGLINELNEKYQFEITKKPTGYGPSDHQTFYEKKIPVFHFFTDTHSDYHRPSDDFESINVPGMRRIADMVTELVLRIDEAPTRPTYQETPRPRVARGNWPYFGSVPDYASQAEGLELKGVAKDGPAEKGGLRAGDIIVQFGDSKIGNVEDFASALSKHKAGEEVKVVARRGEEQITLTVTLESPR